MRRTLFLIPHELFGLPVFGFGWALLVLVAVILVRCLVARRSGASVGQVVNSEGLLWGIFAAVIILVLPRIELTNLDGAPVGMAIRGYGVMLLTGIASAVALAAYRAKRRGIDPEIILSMAPWAFIGGIFGARLFYVIQYRDQFIGSTLGETIINMMRFTEGGLVVYGSFIGGFLAVAFFVFDRRLSLLRFGDIIIPCLFLGLFFGRVGCLFNGCCYGGPCEDASYALYFPPKSPVYERQLRSGELIGLEFEKASGKITSIEASSLAERAGIPVEGTIQGIGDELSYLAEASREIPAEQALPGLHVDVDGQRYRWSPDELPECALPVYPALLISSLSGLTMCLLLCGLSALPLKDGLLMMIGFSAYALLRFGLEIVRVDESGQFGTGLSISQIVSLVVLHLSIGGALWIKLRAGEVGSEPS